MHGKDSRCACGCDRSMAGLRGNAKYALSYCSKRKRAPLTEAEKAWYAVVQYDPCAYCGRVGDYYRPTIGADHIVPLSRGGEADPSNMIGCCSTCNSKKCAIDLLRFLLSRDDRRWRGSR